jgi:3-oxoacyl-[acyl-carrier-protein] synthase I
VNIYVLCAGVVSSLGAGFERLKQGVLSTSAPLLSHQVHGGRHVPVGAIHHPLATNLPLEMEWQSRNNQLIATALDEISPTLQQLMSKFGPERIGVIVGTSTSGIGESERAFRSVAETGLVPVDYTYLQQELGNPSTFVARRVGTAGPSLTISTACSSSAKAFAAAARWLHADLVDAVVVGGSDSLCGLTVQGFSALDSVSDVRSNPMSVNRKGINVGEAAAFFVVSRSPEFQILPHGIRLAGWGETSDAYHLSSPDPTGRGAMDSMRLALARATLKANHIGYVNLHGTGTKLNDSMESRAVGEVLGLEVLCSSTKPITGHTLGAAGALEAAISMVPLISNESVPIHWFDGERDPELAPLRLAEASSSAKGCRAVLSNSFAFGGSNATLIFARD